MLAHLAVLKILPTAPHSQIVQFSVPRCQPSRLQHKSARAVRVSRHVLRFVAGTIFLEPRIYLHRSRWWSHLVVRSFDSFVLGLLRTSHALPQSLAPRSTPAADIYAETMAAGSHGNTFSFTMFTSSKSFLASPGSFRVLSDLSKVSVMSTPDSCKIEIVSSQRIIYRSAIHLLLQDGMFQCQPLEHRHYTHHTSTHLSTQTQLGLTRSKHCAGGLTSATHPRVRPVENSDSTGCMPIVRARTPVTS